MNEQIAKFKSRKTFNWTQERIIWIGYHLNTQNKQCFIKDLPKDVILEILKYLYNINCFDNYDLESLFKVLEIKYNQIFDPTSEKNLISVRDSKTNSFKKVVAQIDYKCANMQCIDKKKCYRILEKWRKRKSL